MVNLFIFLSLILSTPHKCTLNHASLYSVVDAVVKLDECIRKGGISKWRGELLMGDIHFLLGNYAEAEKRYMRVFKMGKHRETRCQAGEKLLALYSFLSNKEKAEQIRRKAKRLCYVLGN